MHPKQPLCRVSIADSYCPCEDQEDFARPVRCKLCRNHFKEQRRLFVVERIGPCVRILRETLFSQVKCFPSHTAAVNEVSFDLAGEYVASCSDDGTVVVNGLYTDERERYAYHRPIKVRTELSVCADCKMKFRLGSS